HQPFEIGQQGRIFHQRLLAAAAGSPNPLRGYVAWRGQLLEAASNRGVRDPRGARHHRDAATPCCPGLRRGPNPPRSLRQRWRQGFVLRPAARDVRSSSVAVVVSNSFSYFLTLPKPRVFVIAGGILGFVGIVLLAALLMVGIEAGSEVVRDLKRDP